MLHKGHKDDNNDNRQPPLKIGNSSNLKNSFEKASTSKHSGKFSPLNFQKSGPPNTSKPGDFQKRVTNQSKERTMLG